MDQIILFILAVAPCLGIICFMYLKNAYKPSPSKYLILSVFYGILSFLLALVLGLLVRNYTQAKEGDLIYQIIHAMVFVGVLEEVSKFVFLRGIVYYNKHFTQPLDGIVHSVMIGMGFALAENFIYMRMGEGGSLILRMVTAIPAHAAFAVIMGYFVGEAKVFPSSAKLFLGMGLFFAAFAHGYYDFFLLQDNIPGLWWQSFMALAIAIVITYNAIKVRENELESST
jgi:RsiW-degrading membrane proteinase PrsW (M82 family)